MVMIGLSGGIASGKSWVAQQLKRLGAAVIDGDEIGHQVLEDPAVKRLARARWGERIFDSGGEIRRGELARIVFSDSDPQRAELAYLESITHPRIRARIQEQLTALIPTVPAVVLDAAVMEKAGWDLHCDAMVFVEATPAVRKQRALARGWTAQQWVDREAAQTDLETKRQRADFIVYNSGGLHSGEPSSEQNVFRQLTAIWQALQLPLPAGLDGTARSGLQPTDSGSS